VDQFRKGNKVVLNWAIPCYRCYQCSRGHTNICENKMQVPLERMQHKDVPIIRSFNLATMSRYTVVHKNALTLIDVDIPFSSAAILGCGVMTGVGSALSAAKVEDGSIVVVLGCGGVGLSVIQGARICSAAKIIAIDINKNRLQLAQKMGATDLILADKTDSSFNKVKKEVLGLSNNRGADYAFEATAQAEHGSVPLLLIRNGGVAIGCSGIEQTIPFNMELFEWDKNYINPLYGQCNPANDFPGLLRLYQEGALLLDEMVTQTYSQNELKQAFEDMHSGKNAKGVIVFDE
jgi:S-(hydroxymethyl)glutathione dehydrogenase/alcohol dehydrogenase